VNVLDACHSGTLLIKSETAWLPVSPKEGIRNLIVFASSLDSQNSLTGHPISQFTEKFRDAALRKAEGIVYYSDIINTLRDEFINNQSQTPYFISQATGREHFIENAKRLDALRYSLQEGRIASVEQAATEQEVSARRVSLLERLQAADQKVVTPERMSTFVDTFMDDLIKKITTSEFADFFDIKIIEHSDFAEPTAEKYIVRILRNEDRADNFVTAKYTRKFRGGNTWAGIATMAFAQLRVTFIPKFMNLNQIVLVVSCAPSLDICYIFEATTQHMLRDFGKFDSSGQEISQRWWKADWLETTEGVIKQIAAKLDEAVRTQLEKAEERLAKPNM
jgi:hypothetical protein